MAQPSRVPSITGDTGKVLDLHRERRRLVIDLSRQRRPHHVAPPAPESLARLAQPHPALSLGRLVGSCTTSPLAVADPPLNAEAEPLTNNDTISKTSTRCSP